MFGSSTLRERLQRRFDASETVLWLAAIAGALAFVWPLMRHPGGLYLDRTFAHDALMNIDDLRAIHQNLFQMFSGKNVLDVLYDSSFYFPQPRPLVTSELQLLAAVVTLPLRGHPILAHSILIIVALVLDCVGGAKCAEALGAGRWARLVAGVAFAFSAYRLPIGTGTASLSIPNPVRDCGDGPLVTHRIDAPGIRCCAVARRTHATLPLLRDVRVRSTARTRVDDAFELSASQSRA
ncbi:MAG: hypothetical protein IPK60_25110 [Sandaracinaceae bacterium]|nr:hypothetical protein [Sandaracinaceae bacterium]